MQTRYYDPAIKRFINADDISYLGENGFSSSYNLFSYCKNNPVLYSDSTGHFALLATIGIIAFSGIVGGVMGAISSASTGGNVLEGAIEGTINGMLGATCGLLISNPIGAVAAAFAGSFVVDVTIQATSQYINGEADICNPYEFEDVMLEDVDYVRSIKTAATTALGTAIPSFEEIIPGTPGAIATALIWGEASALITIADIILTTIFPQPVN